MDLPSIFAGLNQRLIQHAMDHFRVIDVEAGVRIMEPGDEDATLVVVASGDLQLETSSGAIVGRAGASDVLGEMAFFGDGVRKLAVTTRGPSRLLALDVDGYESLREAGHAIVPAIDQRALQGLEDRFAMVCTTIAQHDDGQTLDSLRTGDGIVGRLFSMFAMSPSKSRVVGILEGGAAFAGTPQETLARLAEHLEPTTISKGDTLLPRGDVPNHLSIVASGSVELVTVTGPARGYHVATLEAGDLFGPGAVLEQPSPSAVTVVARERGTLLTLDRLRVAELSATAPDVGSLLRIAAIRASAAQMWRGAVLLAGLVGDRPRTDSIPPSLDYRH